MFTTEDFNITELIEEILENIEETEKETLDESLSQERKKLKELSPEMLFTTKEMTRTRVEVKKRILNTHLELKRDYEEDLEGYKQDRDCELIDKTLLRLKRTEKKIKALKLEILRDYKELELTEEFIDKNYLTVNNHTKLLEWYLDVDALLSDLVEEGFKGKKEDLAECLLYALDATDVYTNTELLTEEEYFKTLVHQMNFVI